MVDNDPERWFILSYSSQFAMLKKETQSLAGRTAMFEPLPLSYSKVPGATVDKSFDTLLFEGFDPTIYAERIVAKFLYTTYIKTYPDKDVRSLLKSKI